MADVSIRDVILFAIGFVLVAIMTPIGMEQIVGANTTGWNASVKTIFTVLLPILYVIGAALVFIPNIRGGGGG